MEGDAIGDPYRFRFSEGTDAALAELDRGGAIVRRSYAEDHDLQVGSPLRLVTPSGRVVQLHVAAVLDQGKFDLDPLAEYDIAFSVPVGTLVAFVAVAVAVGVAAGVVAAIVPARRASRLDVLEALGYE